jgi:hypothetical protein
MPIIGKTLTNPTFDPSALSSCILWLDAADTNTVQLVNGRVSAWLDKSQYKATTVSQATLSRRPYYTPGQSVDFSGGTSSNSLFASFNTTNIPSGVNNQSSDLSIFLVAKRYSDSVTHIVGTSNTGSTSNIRIGFYFSNLDGFTYIGLYGGATPLSTPRVSGFASNYTVSEGNHLIYANVITSNWYLRNWGSNLGSNLTAANNWDWRTIGLHLGGDGVNFYSTSISELLVFPGDINESEMQAIEGYLARKWNLLSKLPSNHIFKSDVPYMTNFNLISEIGRPDTWFDASDRTKIASSGTTLTTWSNEGNFYDQYSAISNASVTSGTPTTGVATQNNLNLISFPDTSRIQYSAIFGSQDRSRFIATRQTVSGNIIFMNQGGVVSSGNDYLGISNNTLIEVAQGVSNTLRTGTIASQLNSFNIYTFVNSSTATGSNRIAITGSNQTLTTSTLAQSYNTNSATTYLNWTTGGQDMGEFISYSSRLRLYQQQKIEGYLAWKWGVKGNLPTTSPYLRFPPLSVAFNPRQISDCILWIDAADPTTVTLTNGFVTSISNKGIATQTSLGEGNGFTYNQTKFNGSYPSFYNSDISGSKLLCRGSNISSTGSTAFFIVGSRDTQTGSTSNYLVDGTSTQRIRVFGLPAGNFQMALTSSTMVNLTSVNITNGFIGSFLFNSATGNPIAYLNGSFNASSNSLTVNGAGLRIGNSTSSNEPWNGHICEVIAYRNVSNAISATNVLSVFQVQLIEGYLAHKWGLTRLLPNGHPYKNFRP